MESNRYETIAYADDVVIVVKGKCPQTLCNLMSNALKLLSSWADSCGLSINPMKTELVLFSRKYKIPKLTPPRVRNIRLNFSNGANYIVTISTRDD